MAKKDIWLSLPFHLSQEVDRLFEELIHRPWGSPLRPTPEAWTPEVDIYETAEVFIVEADLPGVKEEDVTVHAEGGDLVLTGRRVCQRVTAQSSFHRHERHEGRFVRRLPLPTSVVQDNICVTFQAGVLRVTLPKLVRERKPTR